jgi:hypothetical protein
MRPTFCVSGDETAGAKQAEFVGIIC